MKRLLPILATVIASLAHAQMVFLEPPENFHPKLEVATCYVMHEGKALFLKRCSTSSWSHTWGLPGGSVDQNEIPAKAAIRETFEETGINLSEESPIYLGKFYVRDPKKDFVYHMFKCELASKPEKILLVEEEHTEYQWLNLEEALRTLLLVPGEDECISYLIQGKL